MCEQRLCVMSVLQYSKMYKRGNNVQFVDRIMLNYFETNIDNILVEIIIVVDKKL